MDLGFRAEDAVLAETVVFVEGESDRRAVEGVVGWLSEEDTVRGGTLVASLGGCGVVWGTRRDTLRRQIDMFQQVAPYTSAVVLLDSDGRPSEELDECRRAFQPLGVPVTFLERRELEDYWLEAPAVHAVIEQAALDAAEGGSPFPAPNLDEVATALGALRQEKQGKKGSDLLAELFFRLSRCTYPKIRGAQTAIAKLRELSPASAEQLKEEVSRALGAARRRGA
ncbi:MAG: hypothetical protein HY906_03985 [Deltaproteobacteria bacterium]|nr:hypothetical protein [Deltaproteobacteria bacterium]